VQQCIRNQYDGQGGYIGPCHGVTVRDGECSAHLLLRVDVKNRTSEHQGYLMAWTERFEAEARRPQPVSRSRCRHCWRQVAWVATLGALIRGWFRRPDFTAIRPPTPR
jgi:hypothetical protein